jgi:hypothetical protein
VNKLFKMKAENPEYDRVDEHVHCS